MFHASQSLAGCTGSCHGQHACIFLLSGATPGITFCTIMSYLKDHFASCVCANMVLQSHAFVDFVLI